MAQWLLLEKKIHLHNVHVIIPTHIFVQIVRELAENGRDLYLNKKE